MPSSGYTAITFVASEQPTTAKWNLIGSNFESFRLGNAIEDNAIIARHLLAAQINSSKIDWAAATGKIWYEELGRATASGGANPTTLSVTFTPKKYLKIMFIQYTGGATLDSKLRFNSDTANNYQYRTTENGGADTNFNAQSGASLGSNTLEGMHGYFDVVNVAAKLKVGHGLQTYYTAGATQIYRNTQAFKWENNVNLISSVQMQSTVGSYKDGSELLILGHD